MKIFEELRQRKVLQTAAMYFAIAWGATEILSFLIERIPVFPVWTETAIAILFVLGFPVSVFLAWMFDVREGGVRRTDPASGVGKGAIALSVIGMLVVTGVLSYLLLPRIEAEKGLVHAGDLGTVAVLPFENLTGDPSLGYLGLGLAEEIRQRLMSQTDLKVIGRVSMVGFAGVSVDLASLRSLLDAGLVLEGNLQQVAGQLQVNLALLDTATGKQLWANSFNAGRSDWDELRGTIVISLAEQLALTVRVRQTETPVSAEALEAYLRGLATLSQPDVADSWFAEAVRLAPDFADAWARRALLRDEMIWRGQPLSEAWEEAGPMIMRAHEIEPDNLLADFAEASMLWVAQLDGPASLAVLRRAEARAPNHPLVLAGMTITLNYLEEDRVADAVAYGRRYVAQDPLNPDAHNRLSVALRFDQRKLEEALKVNARALELDPHLMRAWDYRVNFQFFANRLADAVSTLTKKGTVENPVSDETIRCMLAILGALLPGERAVPMLEQAIESGLGMTTAHWWCDNSLETLVYLLDVVGEGDKAAAARARLEKWYEENSSIPTNEYPPSFYEGTDWKRCEDVLCRIRTALGEDALAEWLGPEPPLHYFNMKLTTDIVRALIEAGRAEEGRRLAELAVPVYKQRREVVATATVLQLLALSGELDAAVSYAEQIGPEGFYLFGRLTYDHTQWFGVDDLLADDPRWINFKDRAGTRWLEEVAKFDQMVASGEIVLPFAVPGLPGRAGSGRLH